MAALALLLVVSSCSSAHSSKDASTTTARAGSSTTTEKASTAPCAGASGVGGPVPKGLGPGDLVAASDLTAANADSPGFPTGARVWRILYVTIGVDEDHLQLVCGTVAAPTDGPERFGSAGRLLAWTHGTVGLEQSCLPSSDPAKMLWGKMAGGINAVAWGTLAGKHEGKASGGLLQYAVDEGMVVTATDYAPDDTYVVGTMEAAAALDAGRAGTQLMEQTFADTAPSAYDLFVWGHSQGGHAALWTGQLAETYLAATHPSQPTSTLTLVGVAALAPASNFITQPDQTAVQPGDGLADWEMHQNIGLDLPVKTLQMQIGPALFSYIFGSWKQLSDGPAPAASAQFPAFPSGRAPLDLDAVVTASPGAETVSTVKPLCLTGGDAKKVQKAVGFYGNAKANQMLIPEVWNLPTDYEKGQYFRGGLDRTCAAATVPGLTAWCDWLRWNLPGPLASNPYPKAPTVDGNPVPMLIAQGSADDIIHCIAPKGAAKAAVPDAADCMSRALYDSLASATYCPAGKAAGHLELDIVRKDEFRSPATHFSIPGEISARGLSKSASDLVFEGSPLQQFMASAFDRTAKPGCSAKVINPTG